MKFSISFKTPDAVEYACEEQWNDSTADEEFDKLDKHEKQEVKEDFFEEVERFLSTWISYGESVTLEFDTEKGTARVV